jgi:DNA adenine methylase
MAGGILRYPGGKTRAVKHILPYFGKVNSIVSPFFGGGSIEIALAQSGVRVYGYDVFKLLVEFWQEALSSPGELADHIEKHYYPSDKDSFYKLQKRINYLPTRFERAAAFYVLNRTSFSGVTLSGGYTEGDPRFNTRTIDRLRNFSAPGLTVEHEDFELSLKRHPRTMAYLDPPYLNDEQLYGDRGHTHKDFDHQRLFNLLKDRKRWILSYNNHPSVQVLYKDFVKTEPCWVYGMSKNKTSRELLIFSPDIEVEVIN